MKSLIIICLFISSLAQSKKPILQDIGVIGLMSHDLFTWDHENEINLENGRLDLSTIFDYKDGKRWRKGGNPKNGENAPVWSVTKRLVKYHKKLIRTMSFKQARKKTVKKFIGMVKKSYTRLFGIEFPEYAINKMVNNTEQAALRAMHDILPGRVKTLRGKLFPFKSFKLTNFWLAKFYLNDKELKQGIAYFDGKYAEEYKNIKIPFAGVTLNLEKIDKEFIEKFSPYNQEDMLLELQSVGAGRTDIRNVSFIHHVKDLLSKGLCSTGNPWVPKDLDCY